MKAIVLCERSLARESKDFKNFIEEKVNDGNDVKVEGKKTVNGTLDSKKSSGLVQNSEKDGVTTQNSEKRSVKASLKEEVSEQERKRRQSAVESAGRGSHSTGGESNPSGVIGRKSLRSDKSKLECSIKKSISGESENLENSNAPNGSAHFKDPDLNNKMDFPIENEDNSDKNVHMIESDSSGDTSSESLIKTFDKDLGDENKSMHANSKENVQPSLDNMVLDLDENKENEKEEKTPELNEFSESNVSDKHSSGCEIQVGKVETILGLEKESMWAENEFKKSKKNAVEKSEEKLVDECQDIPMSNEVSFKIDGRRDEENHEFGSDENLVSEGEENLEEGMHVELEESDQTEEGSVDEKDSEQTDVNNLDVSKSDGNLTKAESAHCRKRQMVQGSNEDPSSKKKRLSEDRENVNQVQLEEENTKDSSRSASFSSLDCTDSSPKGQFSDEEKGRENSTKTLTEDENLKKVNDSITNEDAGVEKHGTRGKVLSVLEKFRGTLKTLTRSDLEELIIQKLCEVITEKSNVGELRQKAQALEQDQERLKAKVQSLNKQMREMEMVMKKYMSEVQRQIKEGDTHVVTPLKVTRSVGLQVSFFSSTNKVPKPNVTQPVPVSSAPNARNTKVSQGSPKSSSQVSPVTQNARNKVTPSLQKGSPSLLKSPVIQQRKPIPPKSDFTPNALSRPSPQQSLLSNSRGTQSQPQSQSQASRPGFKSVPGTSSHQQPHQEAQQSGSKVIDLTTEDDDRQTLVKPPGSIRVVNNLTQQSAASQNRFAYLLPASPSAGTTSQSRPVLIASTPQPNRQIMCSMPPLLFKGGNVVQGSSQTQMLNQSNKVVLPKPLRHPAPLPQRPINQNTRPSLKLLPPRPALKISKVQTGIVLSWNMSLSPEHAPIASYQLYAYQESDTPPTTSLWKKVGDVKALPLPMACTLTQFMSGHKYHFAVRAVDLHSRIGPFSFPGTIVLV